MKVKIPYKILCCLFVSGIIATHFLQPESVFAKFKIRFKEEIQKSEPIDFKLNTDQSACKVFIDGQYYGETPLDGLKLNPGEHSIRIEKADYQPFVTQFKLYSGEPNTLKVILKKKEVIKYYLAVNHFPAAANVSILNKRITYKPKMALEPGQYHVEVSAEGYHSKRMWLNLKQNTDIEVRLAERREPVTIEQALGYLTITADIKDAKVYIDGKKVGLTPLEKFSVKTGKRRITVAQDGFEPFHKTVDIKENDHQTIAARFRVIQKSKLFVKTIPADAKIVFLDLGIRFQNGMELPVGDYFIEVSAPNYKSKVFLVSLAPEDAETFKIKLDAIADRTKTAEKGVYTILQNGILLDHISNIEWLAAKDHFYNWYRAKSWAENLDAFGGNWRLPTIKELETVCRKAEGLNNIKKLGKGETQVWTESVKGFHSAWVYDLNRKKRAYQLKSNSRGCFSLAIRKQQADKVKQADKE